MWIYVCIYFTTFFIISPSIDLDYHHKCSLYKLNPFHQAWIHKSFHIDGFLSHSSNKELFGRLISTLLCRKTTKGIARTSPRIQPSSRPFPEEHHLLRVRWNKREARRPPSFDMWGQLQRFICAAVRRPCQSNSVEREAIQCRRYEDETLGLGEGDRRFCRKLQVRQGLLHRRSQETEAEGCLWNTAWFDQDRWVLSCCSYSLLSRSSLPFVLMSHMMMIFAFIDSHECCR